MKLIAFAVISFLAITVSAYPGLGTPHQSTTAQSAEQHQSTSTDEMQQFQSTDTRIPQQPYEDKVLAKLAKLTAAYNKKQATFAPIEIEANAKGHRFMDVWDEMDSIVTKLDEAGPNSFETVELWKKYRAAEVKWNGIQPEYKKQYQNYLKVMKVRDSAKAELDLLTENQKLIADRNIEYDAKTGTSPGSCYDIGLLRDQNDEILNQIEKSIEEQKGVMAAMGAMGESKRDSMAKSDELKYKIRFLQIQHEIAGKILRKYNQRQPIGAQVRGFFNSRLPNAQI
ncbi:hypothetical protein BASA50_001133 [Batrachochytrium salamandrivorans]|uniref:Uncharacterized protein n=1 Tax=Batrachochytrium salamandrivorans TaxID=1357716 RepID=A0ABQ8ERQ9_9FUNG|nr:hypothetical protein BASA60_006094 [Batrachochytrium salamandrivorans]KAH6585521.1 hypothetical protein BASA50_001130 [Batrachochytrium salamandrivorans]KAH6585524.1 hypothetical protein BASA50_001133 [Batrachochytrium salamandrivorans]KAH6590852.1 hypothetical protein BASA61_005082 [Batrachochytrium salamandrivorans]KAH9271408.1 hypothetical protein BASA83_006500 [Batrachochytrium salamandrivorans]